QAMGAAISKVSSSDATVVFIARLPGMRTEDGSPWLSHAWARPTPAEGNDPPYSARPRSKSLTEVLLRVFASTCLTITAQYSECDPSFAGNCPDTTTLYGGTRP